MIRVILCENVSRIRRKIKSKNSLIYLLQSKVYNENNLRSVFSERGWRVDVYKSMSLTMYKIIIGRLSTYQRLFIIRKVVGSGVERSKLSLKTGSKNQKLGYYREFGK